jgi:hypothetical protein
MCTPVLWPPGVSMDLKVPHSIYYSGAVRLDAGSVCRAGAHVYTCLCYIATFLMVALMHSAVGAELLCWLGSEAGHLSQPDLRRAALLKEQRTVTGS